jgi:hypothetical protein
MSGYGGDTSGMLGSGRRRVCKCGHSQFGHTSDHAETNGTRSVGGRRLDDCNGPCRTTECKCQAYREVVR